MVSCFIALQGIPGKSEYRLGSIFLRSFYTILDFERDVIGLGINDQLKDLAKAQIIGTNFEPEKEKKPRNGASAIFIVFIFIGVFLFGCCYFIVHKVNKMKKNKQI